MAVCVLAALPGFHASVVEEQDVRTAPSLRTYTGLSTPISRSVVVNAV